MGKAGRVQERRRGNPDERKTFEKTLTKLKEKLLGQTILQTQRTPTERRRSRASSLVYTPVKTLKSNYSVTLSYACN